MTVNCRHCGDPVPTSPGPGAGTAVQAGFCCAGCEAAFDLLNGLGLASYYKRRALDPAMRALKPDEDRPQIDFTSQVHSRTGVCELWLMVDGIHCAACVWVIETILARSPIVQKARVNMTTRRLHLAWDGTADQAESLLEPVMRLGYRLAPFDPRALRHAGGQEEKQLLRCMAVAGFAASNVMLLSVSVWAGYFQDMGPATRDLFHWISALITLPAAVYAGMPFYRSACRALAARRVNMDVPIAFAVIMTVLISIGETARSADHAYFDSALTLLFFLLIGRFLERRARGRARASAEHLLSLNARAVTVLREDAGRQVLSPSALVPGDTVLVAAGERIGVDGIVCSGQSDVDTSLITGESLPAPIREGMAVFTGTLNLSAALRIKVTRTGEGTLLAEIVRLMENAEKGRAAYVDLAEKTANYYAPVVHILAVLTFIYWFGLTDLPWRDALIHAIAVLIITCPCALALAVPVVQVVASGRLMRQGVLLKSATALERLGHVTGIAFDKTGTLTLGKAELTDAPDDATALTLAAGMAANATHPLAKALHRHLPRTPALTGVQEVPGAGLVYESPEGTIRLGSRRFVGATAAETTEGPEVWLSRPGQAPLRFGFSDPLRSDAKDVIRTLRQKGFDIRLLSGDRRGTVAKTAEALDIKTWFAELKPEDKTRQLQSFRAAGENWLMVGDGLNDAPALATAHVSVSPAGAAEVSQNAADIVFQGTRLNPVPEVIEVAKSADRLVKQNIALSILYNVVTIPMAMTGLITPLIAAIAMSTSSIVVILNALRLNVGAKK